MFKENMEATGGSKKSSPVVKAKPFLKWVGGKRQLLDVLNRELVLAGELSPTSRYFEPFLGGGAFFFDRQPGLAVLSDMNPELIAAYQVIRDDVEGLIEDLRRHENTESYFYAMRAKRPGDLSLLERASRMIYLNKTCFNGLYRENRSGQFNTPYGRYANPKMVDEVNLRAVSNALGRPGVEVLNVGYEESVRRAVPGDVVYLDPPYVPLSKTASFASYVKGGFGQAEQEALAGVFRELAGRGVKVMLSNSSAPLVYELYEGFTIVPVSASRSINSQGDKRGKTANEVLVRNF